MSQADGQKHYRVPDSGTYVVVSDYQLIYDDYDAALIAAKSGGSTMYIAKLHTKVEASYNVTKV